MLFEPIYSIGLTLGPDGTGTVAPATKGWGGGYAALGAPYSDAFRREKAPDARELIRLLTGTTYACAHLCADRVASNRLRLYVRTAPGEQKTKNWATRPLSTKRRQWFGRFKHASTFAADGMEVEEVTDHLVLRLLDVQHIGPGNDDYEFDDYDADADGQPTLSGYDLLYLTQLYLETIGRAYWLIAQRDGLGNPSKIALLRSHLVREVPDLTGERVLREYEYGGVYHYDPKDVIRFAFPDLYTGGLAGGYSPTMAAIEKIRISRATDAHTSALLANMARPDAIWSPKGDTEGGGIGEAEARRVRGAMREEFAQAGRGGLLVSEYPGSLQVLGWKPGDVVEIERAKAIKNDIANDFGVPNALLDLNAANLASADAAALQFAESALMPRCNRLASTLRRLLRMFDRTGRMMLMFDSPIPGDKEHDLEQSRTGVTSGISLVDEGRAAIGQDPLPDGGGQVRYVDGTLVAMLPDGTRAPDNMQPAPAAAPAAPPGAPPPDDESGKAVLRELAAVKRLLKGKGVGNRRRPFAGAPARRTATRRAASPAPSPTLRRPERY